MVKMEQRASRRGRIVIIGILLLWIVASVAKAETPADIVLQPSDISIDLKLQQPEFTSGVRACVLQCSADPVDASARLACIDLAAGELGEISIPLTMAIGCLRGISISEAGLISELSANRADIAPGPPFFVP